MWHPILRALWFCLLASGASLLGLVFVACGCSPGWVLLGGIVWGVRWIVGRRLRRPFVTQADEDRFGRQIPAATGPTDFVRRDLGEGAEGDGAEMTEEALDAGVVRDANASSIIPRNRAHPLGQFRIDSPLTTRAVTYLKSHVVVVTDTPANRLVLTRHFQNWGRERGLRDHNVRHFQPVVCEAFFLRTPVEVDMARLRASNAFRDNQRLQVRPASNMVQWLARLLRVSPPSDALREAGGA